MATIRDLAAEYRLRLQLSRDKQEEAKLIAKEIDNLVYSETNEPISYEDKVKIIKSISEVQDIRKGMFEHRDVVLEHSNEEYMELVNMMLSEVEK